MSAGRGDERLRIWRPRGEHAVLCMHGVTPSYALDPIGECVLGGEDLWADHCALATLTPFSVIVPSGASSSCPRSS